MKNISKPILLSIILFFVYSCTTYTPLLYDVRHVSTLGGETTQYGGFFYALPRTVINIDVSVIKTESIPGPFAAYAESLLGIDNAISQRVVSYQIADIEINSIAQPDPEEFYFVGFNPRYTGQNPISFELSESGTLISVNKNRTESNRQFINNRNQNLNNIGIATIHQTPFSQFIGMNVQERVDTIIEKVKIDTITVERKSLRRSLTEKPSEVRARELAAHILKLRDKQFDLITGFAELTYSREALQYMNDQMELQETGYLELFAGVKTQTLIRTRFSLVPSKNTAGQTQILFHFSDTRGISENQIAGSQPVNVTVRPAGILNQLNRLSGTGGQYQPSGFFYRIPDYGSVVITRNNVVLADTSIIINQFGLVKSLPPIQAGIEFFPNTGGLKSVEGF